MNVWNQCGLRVASVSALLPSWCPFCFSMIQLWLLAFATHWSCIAFTMFVVGDRVIALMVWIASVYDMVFGCIAFMMSFSLFSDRVVNC